ncbi:11734_t:CDS:2 [Ambispora gerdemannii]|uniref:11734_t:CDS:1 n=1 Tax=Ambispora gerdemannii TaxID=144530 RepID=A0A9N9F9U2_9GLOM|nr:11734_t:CDS:2 [Ambispora gerdemannii]
MTYWKQPKRSSFSKFVLVVVVVLSNTLLFNTLVEGIKFDLVATAAGTDQSKCISQYVPADTMVVVKVKVGVGYNQKVEVEITDNSSAHNVYRKKKETNSDTPIAFTTQADADINICFTNTLADGYYPDPKYHRTIDLEVDVGAEAIDYHALAIAEKLAPLEAELRKLEQVVQEIVDDMDYLRRREARMRDTNESTNERVKWFSLGTMFVLISLGGWQIIYLKKFFQRKRLID